MDELPFPALKCRPMSGAESFTHAGDSRGFSVLEFWRWMGSDLVSNSMRGMLAEFIVGQALGCELTTRVEWDAYDIVTDAGWKVEVKSAAYCQSWGQRRLSTISFDIAPKKPDNIAVNNSDQRVRRPADAYVFCLLKHQDKATIDPLNLDQWEFYILSTQVLDRSVPNQKSISLSALLKLEPITADFDGLFEAVKSACGE